MITRAELQGPTDLNVEAVQEVFAAPRVVLADALALHTKAKSVLWHMSGSHSRDYHLMFDEQSDQIFPITDDTAERTRKTSGMATRSAGQIAREQRILDDAGYVDLRYLLAELRSDSPQLTKERRRVHQLCDGYGDVEAAGLLENRIDEAEERAWLLYEAPTDPHV